MTDERTGKPEKPKGARGGTGAPVAPDVLEAPGAAAAPKRPLKAVGLISGGLDSMLAAKMLADQGVEVIGLNFSTGFCKVDHRRAVQRKKDLEHPEKLRNEALLAGAETGVPVEVIDVSKEYLDVVTNPKHGYGRFANPCIDCRIFMLNKAKEYADAIGAEVVFTGEVLGQRPMSQHRNALRLIEKETGLQGRLLRPLSARHLQRTEAERRGDLDREAMGQITGRSRREQMEMVERFGIEEYSQPGGGCCFLADENYARRFRDLLEHRGKDSITQDDLVLLKVGRHFRLSPAVKVIVGREEAENVYLERFLAGRWSFEAPEGGSPISLVEGEPGEAELVCAARITARYCDQRGQPLVRVLARRDGQEVWRDVTPIPDAELESIRL